MCGRTACTLNPDEICQLCSYKDTNDVVTTPKWVKNKEKYVPSYNQAPQAYCPVLVAKNNLFRDEKSSERCLASMKWGLIPNWLKRKSENKFSINMNNARFDTLLQKKSFKAPLFKGQRCVIIAEGFYEWKTTANGKQPYFITFSESKDCKSESSSSKLLTMAGIFENTFVDDEDLYSFSVITVDASSDFSCLHHRMPALLVNEKEIDMWLDHNNVSTNDALSLISPKNCLQWYPVSKYVNNSRNNGPDCVKEVTLMPEENKPVTSSCNGIKKWLVPSNLNNSSDIKPQSSRSNKRTVTSLDTWLKKRKPNV